MSDDHISQPRRPSGIQLMLDSGRLHETSTTVQSIASVWQKAVESARDAELPQMSIDGALRSAYDAGHLAALALLAANGLRPASGRGHHEMAFAGAAALGNPRLKDLIPDSEEIRRLRSSSMYDPVIAQPHDRIRALEWIRRTLPVVRAALVAEDSVLKSLLLPFP